MLRGYAGQCAPPSEPYPQTQAQNLGDCCGKAEAPRPYTLKDEALKNAFYHAQEQHKASAAADFFVAHPEFDEFVRLIRSGTIQI